MSKKMLRYIYIIYITMISKLSMNLYGLDSNSNTHQQRQFKTKEEIYYAKYHTRQKNGLVLSQSPVLYKP